MISSIFILYVADQEASRSFYEELLGVAPSLHVPGMTEFCLSENARLGLMPEKGIEKLICPVLPSPSQGKGSPRCELYFYVDDPGAYHQRAVRLGAKDVRPAADMDWGDRVAYVADADGHVVAFARKTGAPGD